MRKKITMLLAALFLTLGTAWAQVYQKIPHTKWTVTALNQAVVQGNEGGIDFLKDENPETFYHSDYSNSYSDGNSGKKKGQDGLQAFMVELPEVMPIDKITYKGRSNGPNNWATKARIYVFETLPDGWPKDGDAVKQLNAMTYTEKEGLLKRTDNTVLGTPAFDNNDNGTWAADQNIKTAEFSSTQQGKYILFVADATTGGNGYLCCGDFHLWQKLEGIVEDKPYFLKINGLDDYYLDTRVGVRSDYGNTICKTTTPVATYFTLSDGYWHISSLPGNERNFVGITNWDAIPGKDTPANWTLHKVDVEHSLWSLAQSTYYGSGDATKHYLGANDGNISGNSKVYTDKTLAQAVKFELVALDEKQTATEAARVALSHIGVGYPAADSEARTTLQAAIDAADATVESINTAIAAYQANTQTVQMPEVGKVYRLVSALPGFKTKKAIYSDNIELKWKDRDAAAMNQLWTVVSISGKNAVLMNVGDARFPQKSDYSTVVSVSTTKNECSLEFLGKGQFQIKANKLQGMHANNHGGGTGTSGNIINYNTGVDAASAWCFEEVAVTKDILDKQIESIENTYTSSLLIKQEGVSGLQTAVDDARTNADYAAAIANLVKAVDEAEIENVDLAYIYMKSRKAQKYAYNDNESLKVTDSKSSPKAIFKLTKANNGTYYVQNGNGLYAQGVNTSQLVKTSTSAVEYTVTRLSSGYYVLRPTSSTNVQGYWHDANNGTGNIVGWGTDAENTQWVFEALTAEEIEKIYTVSDLNAANADVYVTYNGDGYAGDKDVKQVGGFYVLDNAPTTEDFTVKNVGEGMISGVVVDGKSLSVNEGYDGSNIYILKCLKDNSYARYHEGCRLNGEDATNMLTFENNNFYFESLFYIEKGTGDYADYYTIRSVAAPTMYAYNLKTANEDSKVAMKEAPTEGGLTDAYYWKISSFGEVAGNITPKAGDAYGWNKRGSYNGMNHIGYWQGGNGTADNKWFVRLVDEELVPSLHSVVGYPTEESWEEYRPYAQIISRAGIEKLKNANWDMVLPEPGKYYRIKNDSGTGYLSSGTGTGKTQFVAGIGEKATSIFFYDENKKLCSYTTGLYLANNGGFVNYTETVGQAAGTDFTFAKSTEWGKLAIWFNNSSRSFYSDKAGDSNAGSGKQTGQYYRFTVEEVDMSSIISELETLAAKATTIAGYTFIAEATKTQLTTAAANATSAANALKNGAFAKDMIAEIAALIESATHVTDIDGFANNRVYTFLSNRNSEAYMMYDGTNDFVASKYKQTGLTVGSDVKNCQWAVYKSGEGNYYLYNLGAQKFMGTETAADTGIPFSDKPQTTELKFKKSDVATHPIMISSNGGKGTVNHSNVSSFTNNYGIINWNNNFGHPSDPGNVHRVAIVGELDEATLGTIKELVNVFEKGDILKEFNELVYSARGYISWMVWGRYDHELYDNPEAVAGEIERIDLSIGDGEDATIAEIQAAIQEIEAIIAGFDIAEITPGFYYFVNYDYDDAGEYLSDDISANGNQRTLTTGVSAKNIFYYDGQKLFAYASGFGFEFGICNTSTPGEMNHFEFGMAYEPGKYTVKSAQGTSNETPTYSSRYWKNEGNSELGYVEVDAAADASGWDIQPVDKLPVTIGSLLHATFYAPVAVNIPKGVKAYTGVVNDVWLTLTEVTGVIPAGTAVVLIAEKAGTYDMEIVKSDKKFEGTSHFLGTAPTIVNDKKNAEDKYYTLQTHDFDGDGTKSVAFKKFTGDNLNGFKTYLALPAGTKATALRIRYAGTTEIEEAIADGEQEMVIYDLAGRRIEKIVEKGVYIVNGKKVVIR